MARSMLIVAGAACAAVLLAGCGDDEGEAAQASQAARPTAAATPGAAAAAAAAKNPLVEKPHIEQRVACAIPDQPSDPKGGACDPKAPSCGEHLYCLTLAQGTFCEPCPERDGIRHVFKERDFDPEHNRDPFQSYVVQVNSPGTPSSVSDKCPRADQMVATSYSYADLKLVGIVAQGTQRKVLMMGGPLGYIIKRGDCVGKEKAVVKDIGLGYVTFQLDPDEYSVQLNPKQLMVTEPEPAPAAPRTKISPSVTPPAVLPPGGAPPIQGAGGSPAPPAGRGSAAPPAAPAVPAGRGSAAPAEAPPPPPRKP